MVTVGGVEGAEGGWAGATGRLLDNPTIDVGTGPRSTEIGTLTDLDIGFVQTFETGGQRGERGFSGP